MRITKSIAESISKTEKLKKFDPVIEKNKQALILEAEKIIKAQNTVKIPQNLIDEGFVRTCSRFSLVVEQESVYGRTKYFDLHGSYPVTVFKDNFNVKFEGRIKELYEKYKKSINEGADFETNLRRTILSFTTSVSLLKHIPELKEYFKDESKPMALVPIDQINNIRKILRKST